MIKKLKTLNQIKDEFRHIVCEHHIFFTDLNIPDIPYTMYETFGKEIEVKMSLMEGENFCSENGYIYHKDFFIDEINKEEENYINKMNVDSQLLARIGQLTFLADNECTCEQVGILYCPSCLATKALNNIAEIVNEAFDGIL